MIRQLSHAGSKLANLVLPHQCVICRCFADSTGLCASCWRGLAPIAAPVCRRCGLPLGHTLSDPLCAVCFTAPPPLAAIRAALQYNDSSRQLILAFKHGDALQLTPFLSALVARDFAALCTTDTLVVPVPLHSRRYLKRRYNQVGRAGPASVPDHRGRTVCPASADTPARNHQPGRSQPPPAPPQSGRGFCRAAGRARQPGRATCASCR